jgi:hypothetical protein
MANSGESKIPRKSIADQFHYDYKRMKEINQRRSQEIEKEKGYVLPEQQNQETQINPDYISP